MKADRFVGRGGSSAGATGLLSTAAAMATLDLFIVNVAFPSISRDFHGTSLADLSWVLNGYAVVYAALLVPLGRFSDRYGRRRGFLLGVAVFTTASAACAVSHSLWQLVLFRGLQAAGAAALTPTSLGLLLDATAAADRPRAVRTWAAIGAVAAAAGPVLGGILVQASWRWIFLVNIPIGLLALLLAPRLVRDSRDPSVTKSPDLLGSALLAMGIAAVALALVKAPAWGWAAPATLASLGVALLSTAAFAVRSSRHPLPVVELSLLRVRTFAWANVTGLLYAVAFAAGLLAAIVWMQDVWGWSALRTGLAIAPGPLVVPVFTAVGQRLSRRWSSGALVSLGCLLIGAGNALIALRVGATPRYASDFLPGWLVMGAGVGLAMPTIVSAATVALPPSRTATGSAIVAMGRQIGLTLGVSLLVMTIGTPTSFAGSHDAFVRAWWGVAGLSLLAAVTGLGISAGVPGRRQVAAVRRAASRVFDGGHLGPVHNYVTR